MYIVSTSRAQEGAKGANENSGFSRIPRIPRLTHRIVYFDAHFGLRLAYADEYPDLGIARSDVQFAESSALARFGRIGHRTALAGGGGRGRTTTALTGDPLLHAGQVDGRHLLGRPAVAPVGDDAVDPRLGEAALRGEYARDESFDAEVRSLRIALVLGDANVAAIVYHGIVVARYPLLQCREVGSRHVLLGSTLAPIRGNTVGPVLREASLGREIPREEILDLQLRPSRVALFFRGARRCRRHDVVVIHDDVVDVIHLGAVQSQLQDAGRLDDRRIAVRAPIRPAVLVKASGGGILADVEVIRADAHSRTRRIPAFVHGRARDVLHDGIVRGYVRRDVLYVRILVEDRFVRRRLQVRHVRSYSVPQGHGQRRLHDAVDVYILADVDFRNDRRLTRIAIAYHQHRQFADADWIDADDVIDIVVPGVQYESREQSQ